MVSSRLPPLPLHNQGSHIPVCTQPSPLDLDSCCQWLPGYLAASQMQRAKTRASVLPPKTSFLISVNGCEASKWPGPKTLQSSLTLPFLKKPHPERQPILAAPPSKQIPNPFPLVRRFPWPGLCTSNLAAATSPWRLRPPQHSSMAILSKGKSDPVLLKILPWLPTTPQVKAEVPKRLIRPHAGPSSLTS